MCYIIGLGYNDHTITGSVSDIDLIDPDNNANTFYGNYAKNIQKIHNYADKSIIFVLTLPYTKRLNSSKNSIDDYLNISQVHIIDLNLYIDLFNSNFIKNHMCPDNIHFNPMGYSNISDLLYHILGKYMMDNNDYFVDAPYISYV